MRCGDGGAKFAYLAGLEDGPIAGRERIRRPGVHGCNAEQALGGGSQSFELGDDELFAGLGAEAVHVKSVESTTPDGEARDLIVRLAEFLREYESEWAISPHRR